MNLRLWQGNDFAVKLRGCSGFGGKISAILELPHNLAD